SAAQVAEMLGSLGADLVWPILEKIAAGDGKGTIEEAERIGERSVSLDTALEDLASILHRVALAQAGAAPSPDDPDAPRVAAMAQKLDAGRVQVMYQIALLGRRDLPLAPDELAGFTMSLLRMLSFASASSEPRPVAAPARPAGASQPAAAKSATGFDGDWPGFVERAGLTGMAGMAARNAELASYDNNHLELVVPESAKMYAEKGYLDKLKADLAPHFGANFRVTVRVGSTNGKTVAAAKSREQEKLQARAAQSIEGDPFVKSLVQDLGAEVVPSSIRPPEAGN
ncbi:MAG TPA: DNA polymerase III subunit gamma/tau C-terminal domain-containing protein, partial [Usitatibacter sp.]|nr:DNA polymerase III subunit gamma/tau C-terminal domain-containing protein [Usitatibacter sp.]